MIIPILDDQNKFKLVTRRHETHGKRKLSMAHEVSKTYCLFIQFPERRWRSPLSKQEHIDGHEPSDKSYFNGWIWLQGPFQTGGQLFMRLKVKHLFSQIITSLEYRGKINLTEWSHTEACAHTEFWVKWTFKAILMN